MVTDESASLCLLDLTALDAGRADPQTLGCAIDFCLHGAEVDVPTPLGDIVRVRDVITKLRAFAADITNLSHDSLQNPELSRNPEPAVTAFIAMCEEGGRASRQNDAHTGAEILVYPK